MTAIEDITLASGSATPLRVCEALESYGVVRVPGFVAPSEIMEELEEARFATANLVNYRNPYGECCRFTLNPTTSHLSRSRDLIQGTHLSVLPPELPLTRHIIGGDFFRDVVTTYLSTSGGFMEVVALTRDHIPDTTAVYGKLHFDRRHQLKFIVYLNDVNESNGAFGCIPGSHIEGRRLFIEAWQRVLGIDLQDPSTIDVAAAAVPEDDPKYRLVPCILEGVEAIGAFDVRKDRLSIGGVAGTLVAFDTDLLHYGGFVNDASKERWTLKGHTFAQV